MEVLTITQCGEKLKSLARPDPAVIELTEGSPVTLLVERDDLAFFEDTEIGRRIG